MRQRGLVPCDCGMCYFCTHGMTNGIAHRGGNRDWEVVYANGVRVRTKGCTDVRVSLGMKSGRYCGMCYRKQHASGLSPEAKKAKCKTSVMGCACCNEPICKFCWAEGYDQHK